MLGTALERARAGAFVRRRAERELLSAGLAADVPDWSVLWVHGPGGVGKSTLIARLALDAADAQARAATVDARNNDVALPMPVAPPVTRMTLSVKSNR